MATEKTKELLDLIRLYQEKYNRNPRLSEMTKELNISNSAVLQRVDSLKKEGLISMPDGVLSITLKPKYDVFLSYSRKDQDIANKIYSNMINDGFKVWKDTHEIKIGNDFSDEIYNAIKNCKTFIVLLSDNSLRSAYVKEEVKFAKQHQISNELPVILPIEITAITEEIFPDIQTIQRVKLNNVNDELELINLKDSVQTYAYQINVGSDSPSFDSKFTKFLSNVDSDLKKRGENKEFPYLEIKIKPLENPQIDHYSNLEKILEECVVDVQRWGGFNFPPYYPNSDLAVERAQDKIKFFKIFNDGWFRTWEFLYFNFDINGNFYYKSSLREQYSTQLQINDKFAIDWMLLDIGRTFMFVNNLISNTKSNRWELTIRYSGLDQRELTILNSRRGDLHWKYISSENIFEKSTIIDKNTQLNKSVYDLAYEILWLFNWRNINVQMLENDINSILSGTYPE